MKKIQQQKLLETMLKLKKTHKLLHTFLGVSQGEFFILRKIVKLTKELPKNKPGVKISELSTASQMSKPAISQMLNSAEDKGLIERITTKEDRRVVYVKLTDDGDAKFQKTSKKLVELFDKIVDELGEEDTAIFVRLLDKLYDILENLG